MSNFKPSKPVNIKKPINSNNNPTDDSDDDISVVRHFKQHKDASVNTNAQIQQKIDQLLKKQQEQIDEDYVVLCQATSIQTADDHATSYYGVDADFDPLAPYYNESTVQWKIGVTPLNTSGTKTYVIKLSNIMNQNTLQQYIDAGVVQFTLLDMSVQLVPIQFTESTMGASTLKIQQNNFFETQIHKIYESTVAQLNEEITGLVFNIDTTIPIAELLDVPIVTITYKWYGAKFEEEPVSPLTVNVLMLITTTLSTLVNEPPQSRYHVKGANTPVPLPTKFL